MAQHRYIVGATDRDCPPPASLLSGSIDTCSEPAWPWIISEPGTPKHYLCFLYPDIEDGSLRADVYRQFMQDHGAGDKVRV